MGLGIGTIGVFNDPRFDGSRKVNIHSMRLEGNDDDKVNQEGAAQDRCQNEMQDVFEIHARVLRSVIRFGRDAIVKTIAAVA